MRNNTEYDIAKDMINYINSINNKKFINEEVEATAEDKQYIETALKTAFQNIAIKINGINLDKDQKTFEITFEVLNINVVYNNENALITCSLLELDEPQIQALEKIIANQKTIADDINSSILNK